MATFVKTPAGTWKAVIKYKGRILKTRTFKRKADASAWATEFEGQKDNISARFRCGPLTLKQVADRYLDHYDKKDPSRPKLVGYWVDALGTRQFLDITETDVKRELIQYASGEYRGRQRSISSVHRLLAALQGLYTFAEVQGDWLVPAHVNPSKGIPVRNIKARAAEKKKRWLTDDELPRLLAACRNSKWDRLHTFVRLALSSGARFSELNNLRWEDVDLGKRQFHLHDSKNGQERDVRFGPEMVPDLMAIRQPSGLVFPSARDPNRPRTGMAAWYAALAEAGIEGLRFHDLRATHATWLRDDGMTTEQIAVRLGHSSPKVTERYMREGNDDACRAQADASTSRRLGNG